MTEAAGREEENEESGGAFAWLRAPLGWATLAALALAASLYYPLFFPGTPRGLGAQSEQFFFEANEAAGAPVLVLTLWLFYRRSHYLDLLKSPGAPATAAIAFAITIALFSWGVYTQSLDLQLASSMSLLVGAALLLGGKLGLRAFWLPIVFMGFALPISPVLLSAVLYPVQLATAQYAGFVLNAIGVESLVQGDQILRPENTFVVIETCSGMRTVITLTMLTILLIDLFERRGWHAAILIGLAPIVAFLTNGIRVVTLVLNPYSDVASIHNLQGIAMLLVGLTVIYLIDGALERSSSRAPDAGDEDPLARRPSAGESDRTTTLRVLVICAVLIGMHGIGQRVKPWPFKWYVGEQAGDLLVRVFDEWPSEKLAPDYNFLGSVHFLTWQSRRVRVEGGFVDVLLAAADEQRREQTILTPRLAWPASGFVVMEDARLPIETLGERDVAATATKTVRRLVLGRGPRSVLSYSWYARSRSLPVEWFRQAAALDRSPFVRPRHILAIRLSTNLGRGESGRDAAERRIRRVYDRLAPELPEFGATFPSDLDPRSHTILEAGP